MKDQIIQYWHKCDKRQPEEDGSYLLYIPNLRKQTIAEYNDGKWTINNVLATTVASLYYGKAEGCLWTYSTKDPDDENIIGE